MGLKRVHGEWLDQNGQIIPVDGFNWAVDEPKEHGDCVVADREKE